MSKEEKFSNLFAFDLDGTLVHPLGNQLRGIPKYLLETLFELSGRAHVIVATGRRFKAAMLDLQHLPPMKYRVVHNGLVIKDQDEATVLSRELPLLEAIDIARLVESFGYPAFLVSDGHTNSVDYTFTKITQEKSIAAQIVAARPFQKSRVILNWEVASGEVTYPILEVATFASFEEMSSLAEKIGPRLPKGIRAVLVRNVGHTSNVSVLEIFGENCSKGHAVEWVRQKLGVTHVTSVGDDGNDLEMLEFADIGVVMDHAEDRVKAAGNVHVTGPEGLTDYLRKWLDQ